MKKTLFLIYVLASFSMFAFGEDSKIVREDRIWTYCFEDNHYGNITKQLVNCKFDGTENIGGHTYYKLNYWFPDEENPTPQTIAYMREQNGVVYLLAQQDEIPCDIYDIDFPVTIDRNLKLPQNSEIKIYDFSHSSDDIIFDIVDIEPYDTGTRKLTANYVLQLSKCHKEKVSVKDKELNVCQLEHYSEYYWPENIDYNSSYNLKHNMSAIYAEGIGNIGRGLLHYMSRADWPTGFDYGNCYFLRQTDVYGKVLFDVTWLDDQSGVTSPAEQTQHPDNKAYDLQGYPVDNPARGTVYIQNGEKRIAR